MLNPRCRKVGITFKPHLHQNVNLSWQSIIFELEVVGSAAVKEKKAKERRTKALKTGKKKKINLKLESNTDKRSLILKAFSYSSFIVICSPVRLQLL